MTLPRITSKRRLVQTLLILTALLLPFLTLNGNPVLRMDIGLRTLFMAGVAVRIDQFYLVLLATLFVGVLFLLLTVVLGRVWCGWLCPQTVFNDLAELLNARFQKKLSPGMSHLLEHIVAVVISSAVAFSLLCWFMAPGLVWSSLVHFSGNPLLAGCFLLLLLPGYLNLLLVKRSFCHSYCPYGRFQAALVDAGTLNLAFLEETRGLCLRCNACVRECPMGIDVRDGFQIECIGCGRCIDACRGVMERRPGGAGLIDYRFGTVKGTRFRLGRKTLALSVLAMLLGVGLVWGLAGRNQSAFALQRIATVEPHTMPDGTLAQPWRAIIGNRSEMPANYSIRVADGQADGINLAGPVSDIRISANEHREITFLVCRKQGRPPRPVTVQLFNGDLLVASVSMKP